MYAGERFMRTRYKYLCMSERGLCTPEVIFYVCQKEVHAHQRIMFMYVGERFIHTRDKCLCMSERGLCTPEINIYVCQREVDAH